MTDRMKEALFSSLGPAVHDAIVLDLYAGSGGLGLEALSRGAARATFVEHDRRALGALRANVEAVGLGGDVVASTVERFLERSSTEADLVFVDPPYDLPLPSLSMVLDAVLARMSPAAVLVLHRRHGDEEPDWPEGLTIADRRRYGGAELFRAHRSEQA